MTTPPRPDQTPAEQRVSAVAERRRLFTLAHGLDRPTTAGVPDIPLARYDTCGCGHARFMHGPNGVPVASDFGEACDGFTLAQRCPPHPLTA